MSILIKGMGMPKSCFECPMRRKVDPDTIKCLATGERFEETFAGTIETRNRGNCPLVPVPKHGDLIDREALINDMANMIPWAVESPEEIAMVDGLSAGYEAVKDAPTVIEAEEG